jgi:hypothetical protein
MTKSEPISSGTDRLAPLGGTLGRGGIPPPFRRALALPNGILAAVSFFLALAPPASARARLRNFLYYYMTIWNITQWNTSIEL